MSGQERVQKLLARSGVASRRGSEQLVREGRVTVNGKVVSLGDKADPKRDSIKVDGKRIRLPTTHRYFLLNKPRGYISSHKDPEERSTVFDLIPPAMRNGLVMVGRLDYLTEGLLILTDDGELAQRVAHPRYGGSKTYEVKVKGVPEDAKLDRLRNGIVIDGRRTAPCGIRRLDKAKGRKVVSNSWLQVELKEGRTRQIREMFQRIGHPVARLRRVAIGPVSDPDIPLGAFRELSEGEVDQLYGRKPKKKVRRVRRSPDRARRK